MALFSIFGIYNANKANLVICSNRVYIPVEETNKY